VSPVQAAVALDLQNLATLEAMRPADGAPDRHVGPRHLESGRLAVIRIGDGFTLASFDVIEQQTGLGAEALARRIAEKR
jgi:hypothetical protein